MNSPNDLSTRSSSSGVPALPPAKDFTEQMKHLDYASSMQKPPIQPNYSISTQPNIQYPPNQHMMGSPQSMPQSRIMQPPIISTYQQDHQQYRGATYTSNYTPHQTPPDNKQHVMDAVTAHEHQVLTQYFNQLTNMVNSSNPEFGYHIHWILSTLYSAKRINQEYFTKCWTQYTSLMSLHDQETMEAIVRARRAQETPETKTCEPLFSKVTDKARILTKKQGDKAEKEVRAILKAKEQAKNSPKMEALHAKTARRRVVHNDEEYDASYEANELSNLSPLMSPAKKVRRSTKSLQPRKKIDFAEPPKLCAVLFIASNWLFPFMFENIVVPDDSRPERPYKVTTKCLAVGSPEKYTKTANMFEAVDQLSSKFPGSFNVLFICSSVKDTLKAFRTLSRGKDIIPMNMNHYMLVNFNTYVADVMYAARAMKPGSFELDNKIFANITKQAFLYVSLTGNKLSIVPTHHYLAATMSTITIEIPSKSPIYHFTEEQLQSIDFSLDEFNMPFMVLSKYLSQIIPETLVLVPVAEKIKEIIDKHLERSGSLQPVNVVSVSSMNEHEIEYYLRTYIPFRPDHTLSLSIRDSGMLEMAKCRFV